VGFAAELLREYDTIGDAILFKVLSKVDIGRSPSQFKIPYGESVESVLDIKRTATGEDLQKRKVLSLELKSERMVDDEFV